MMTFLRAGVALGLMFGLAAGLLLGWRVGIAAGVLSGVGFGLGMSTFMAYQRRAIAGRFASEEGERVLKEGPANHFVGLEGVGGWLYLTNRRLFFRSHSINIQVHEWSLPLASIQIAKPTLTMRVIPNGLLVHSKEGADDRFVVEGRNSWVAAISDVIRDLTASP